MGEREREIRQLRNCIAVMADAIDVADNIITVTCGTDEPPEWPRAFRKVVRARAALSTPQSPESGGEVGNAR